MSDSDYTKFRGKCKEMSQALVDANPNLTLVRGHYHCSMWGKQPHWWVRDVNGSVIDPTKDQFPSKGFGKYEEFDGFVECSQCGKRMTEKEVHRSHGSYVFCSTLCNMRFVGL